MEGMREVNKMEDAVGRGRGWCGSWSGWGAVARGTRPVWDVVGVGRGWCAGGFGAVLVWGRTWSG